MQTYTSIFAMVSNRHLIFKLFRALHVWVKFIVKNENFIFFNFRKIFLFQKSAILAYSRALHVWVKFIVKNENFIFFNF